MAQKQPIFSQFHIDVNQVKRSSTWYKNQVDSMKRGRITGKRLLNDNTQSLTTQIRPGSLYFFFYDPKHKDTLPHYDMFPMVFPFKSISGGFLGLNLHYLGYPERFALFKKLLQINGSTIDDTTKMKFSWGTIMSMSQVPSAQHCVKHYLNEHVRSQFLKVEPNDWTTSMLLPVEKFVGATKEQVWRQSRKK